MFEFRRWTPSSGASDWDSLADPRGSRKGKVPKSYDVEMQIHSPSLSGSTNVSIAEPANLADSSHQSTLRRYLLSNIDKTWTDLLLIVCGFISGLVDGLSFNYWWSFSDMQTGNIIWIALGVSGKPDSPDKLWAKALIAVGAFLLGNLCFIYGSRLLGPLRRLTMILSFALQTLLLLIPAVLVQVHTISSTPEHNPTEWLSDVVISLLAFQAAGQILASKFLGFPEIPTVALTALTCDLLLDEKLFQRPWSSNPKRNRKLGFLIALFCGAMTAGGIAKGPGLACGLWLAMALKGAITVSWFMWSETETQPSEKVVR